MDFNLFAYTSDEWWILTCSLIHQMSDVLVHEHIPEQCPSAFIFIFSVKSEETEPVCIAPIRTLLRMNIHVGQGVDEQIMHSKH
jgi:hypothetical protein